MYLGAQRKYQRAEGTNIHIESKYSPLEMTSTCDTFQESSMFLESSLCKSLFQT